jgi:hypothetical protein
MLPARFQRNTTTFTTWVPPPLYFQLHRLKDGYRSILALTNGSTHVFMSCWLAGSALKKGKKNEDGRSGVHIKANFWSFGVHPSILPRLSCFLQKPTGTAFMVLGFSQNTRYGNLWSCCSVPLPSKIRRVYGRWRLLSYENHTSSFHELHCSSLPSLLEKRPSR